MAGTNCFSWGFSANNPDRVGQLQTKLTAIMFMKAELLNWKMFSSLVKMFTLLSAMLFVTLNQIRQKKIKNEPSFLPIMHLHSSQSSEMHVFFFLWPFPTWNINLSRCCVFVHRQLPPSITHPDVFGVLPFSDPHHPQELVYIVAGVADYSSEDDQHVIHIQWPHNLVGRALIGRHGLPHLKTSTTGVRL